MNYVLRKASIPYGGVVYVRIPDGVDKFIISRKERSDLVPISVIMYFREYGVYARSFSNVSSGTGIVRMYDRITKVSRRYGYKGK